MALPEIQQFLKELQTSDVELYGTKLKKLNELTRKVSQNIGTANIDEADKLLNAIEPSDFYSKRTRLELANVLQRPVPILEAFASEDKVLIERALQFRWIYTGPTSILTLNGNNDLVQSVFPRISFSCRKRIIHRFSKYCKDEQRLEGVYRAIEEKYGIASAIQLLPACSESFIQPILMDEKKVQLTSRQLEQILIRLPTLAISYLSKFYLLLWKERESNKYLINNSYRVVLAKLAKLHPTEFMDLFEKYGDLVAELTLGPKVTRAMLKEESNVERIIQSAAKYARILHQKETMKRLDNEKFKRFFTSLLPTSITSFQLVFEIGRQGYRGEKDSLFVWLQKFPKEKRFEVLEEAFENVYKKKLLEFPEFMTSRLIQLLPKDMRSKWVDKRLNLPDSQYLYQSLGSVPSHHDGFWEAFRETSQSIPRLKSYLALEGDIHRRAELLSMMVVSCAINDDLTALADVCKYVASRFRNDHIQVRSEFLNAIVNRFDLMKLNDEHWVAINELLQISSMNNEFSQHSNYILRILEKSIQYRLLKNLSVDTQIQHYIKIQTRTYCWGESWNILIKHPELEKQCLKLFAQQIAQIYPGGGPFPSNSSLTAGIISMAESVAGWNRRHTKDLMTVTEFPWLTARLQEVLEGMDETNKTRVVLAFTRDPQAREKYFSTLLKSSPLPPILIHFLRTSPSTISANTESILSFILRALSLRNYVGFFKVLLRQGHRTISENFLKYLQEIIADEDEMLRERANAIKISSLMMTPKNFLEIVKKYTPEDSKMDTSIEDIETKYEMSKAVSYSLKNIQQPSLGLPVLLDFCKGDYLKLVIGSLYSLCYNAPEASTITFLRELVNRPVSVKKHAIRLMTTISNKRNIISFLKDLWESETKNNSIRHLIFQRIFQLFLFESSEDNFKLLKTAIGGLTLADQNYLSSLGSFQNIEHIPDQYLQDYFEVCWQVVDSLEKPGPEIKWALASILQGITPDRISLLESSFLKGILKKYLFLINQDQNLESNVVYLAVKYLLYHRKEEQSVEVNLILECLQQRLTGSDQWDKPDENIITLYPCKQALSSFIEQLCIESFKCPYIKLRDDGRAKTLMEALVERLSEVVNPSEIFIDSLFLRLSVIFHSRPEIKLGEDLFEMGKQVGKLADELIQVYKPEIIGIFSETLKRFVSLCYKFRLTENEGNGGRIIHVVDGILHSTGSIDSQIIAAQFLSSTYPKPHVLEEEYKRLVTELRKIQDKTVQIFVNYRLTQSRPIGYFDMLV